MQLGRIGGGQGLRRERREQEESEIWNGESEMGCGGSEEQVGGLVGSGERVRDLGE